MGRDRSPCHLSVVTLLSVPEMAGTAGQHSWIPLFPTSASPLCSQLLLAFSLLLPLLPAGAVAGLRGSGNLLEPAAPRPGQPWPLLTETPQPRGRPWRGHPTHLEEESDLLLRDPPQL